LAVCAEGVESALAFDFLDDAGCDRAQGDFIGKPSPAGQFESFILAWNGIHHARKKIAG
jgi:EAL domain-containing protein (putative c-di-GMP-specific phosphodiesterase class I)